MNLKKLIIFSLFLMFLNSCQNTVNLNHSTPEKLVDQQQEKKSEEILNVAPKLEKINTNAALYSLIISTGIPLKKNIDSMAFQIFDLDCRVTLPKGSQSCSFKTLNKNLITMNTSSSEELYGILYSLKIPHGDSGVSTAFLECRKYSGFQNIGCDIAIPIMQLEP